MTLGPEIVGLLLPQGRPFRMVDRLVSLSSDPVGLRAQRLITVNEAIFEGHFPDLPMWPGAYTIEGLAQSCQLLLGLAATAQAMHADAESPADALWDDLRHMALALRRELDPGGRGAALLEGFRPQPVEGVLAAVDVRLTHPVFAGDILDYDVTIEGRLGPMVRLAVRATVGDREVARGRLSVAGRGQR